MFGGIVNVDKIKTITVSNTFAFQATGTRSSTDVTVHVLVTGATIAATRTITITSGAALSPEAVHYARGAMLVAMHNALCVAIANGIGIDNDDLVLTEEQCAEVARLSSVVPSPACVIID